jgi:succinyl-CoA synthetase beta subunit
VALERRFGGPVIITSTQGGGNIEEIAAENPDAMIHYPIDIVTGLTHSEAMNVAGKLGFRGQALEQVLIRLLFINISIVQVLFSRLPIPWSNYTSYSWKKISCC